MRESISEISLLNTAVCSFLLIVGASDFRITREYLLFLSNYGYLNRYDAKNREEAEYHININIFSEIEEIIAEQPKDESLLKSLDEIRASEVISEFERKGTELTPRLRVST